MKKKLWIAIPIALLVILFAWRIFGGTSKKKEMGRGGPQAVAVETAKVEIMDLDDSAMFSGNLKAAGSFILSPKVAGQLAQLYVDIGDTVSRGQVVGQLEDSLFRLEFDKAKANLEQAASSLAEAQKELDHSRQLLAKHFISQDEFDRINAKYVTEQAKHRAALAAKNAAEIQLSHTRIKADWSGGPSTRVIGERFAEPGQLLSAGAPLVSVLDISSLKVEIDVIESDYTRLKVGQTATLNSDSWPGGGIQRPREPDCPHASGKLAPGKDRTQRGKSRSKAETGNVCTCQDCFSNQERRASHTQRGAEQTPW